MKRHVLIVKPEDINNLLCKFPGNRPVKPNKQLLESIRKFNRTFNPILIGKKILSTETIDGKIVHEDDRYPILDGQHRAWACVELGIPIVCMVDETIDYERDKMALAALQKAKAWNIDNFVDFLSSHDSLLAKRLQSLIEEYSPTFTSTQVAATFYVGFSTSPKSLIESGKYELDEDMGHWVLNSCESLNLTATTFIRAIKYLYSKNGKFSIKRLREKIETSKIDWSTKEVDVIEQILPIYNEGLFEDEMIEYDSPKKRWFPNDIKQKALFRANGQCEYVDPKGNRCEEKSNLEYDHDLPFKYGGASSIENCKVLCIGHNRSKGTK